MPQGTNRRSFVRQAVAGAGVPYGMDFDLTS